VLLFAAALGLTMPVVFGLAPAVSSSRADRLSMRTDTASRETTRARELLVACEVALAVVLLVGSILLSRTLFRLQQVDPGFRPDHLVSFMVSLPRARYPDDAAQARGFAEIERRLREVPGVDAVGGSSRIALRGTTFTSDATIEGRAPDDFERELRHQSVTPDYFRTMGVHLLAGRFLTDHDGPASLVTLVNESLVRRYFRGADPLGTRIKFGKPTGTDTWLTIVGVVADEKQDGLNTDARPEAYVPLAASTQNPFTFVVRSSMTTDALVDAARRTVVGVDKDLAITDVAPLADVIDASIASERFRAMLIGGFAGIALFLAALGIYGVLAYAVSTRAREIGIRLALGARRRELFTMVVTQGMRPVFAGIAVGLAGALALPRLVESLLFCVRAGDPASYALSIAVLAATALAACAIPAARAMRVDPLIALRED
jgi:putative ABC transport system permease protein